jgi:hypothetical protein
VLFRHFILCYRPNGYLFDKEAILEYIITKKNEFFRKLKEYEKQKRKEKVIFLLQMPQGWGMMLTIHPRIVPRLRLSRRYTSSPP